MLFDLQPSGNPPIVRRLPVAPVRTSLPGVRARYGIDRAAWIWDHAGPVERPEFRRFRLRFAWSGGALRLQWTADQAAALHVDGHWVARGPDAGPPWSYAFSELAIELEPGDHVFDVLAWWLGEAAPESRMTVGPGFVMAGIDTDPALVDTGRASWQVAVAEGYSVDPEAPQAEVLASGANGVIDLRGVDARGAAWGDPVVRTRPLGDSAHGSRGGPRVMEPSELPEMPVRWSCPGAIVAMVQALGPRDAIPYGSAVDAGHPVQGPLRDPSTPWVVPPWSGVTLVWDLGTYRAGYPAVTLAGGRDAEVRMTWAESLYDGPDFRAKAKGRRDRVEGKYLVEGLGDRFIGGGGPSRRLVPPWWRCGRFCRIDLVTEAEPLTLERLAFGESGYPLDWSGSFEAEGHAGLPGVLAACRRTLELGSWDTLLDSPYYEQLMYLGDAWIHSLCLAVGTTDARLSRRALGLFEQSRRAWGGLTTSRFPCRGDQLVASFSILWVVMVKDHAWWRGDLALCRELLTGCRQTLDIVLGWRREDGLVGRFLGWPFIDWSPGWPRGIPPGALEGPCALHHLVLLLALDAATMLEDWVGEPEMAALQRRRAAELRACIRARFFDGTRGCLADDDSRTRWSVHAQVLGVLAGVLGAGEGTTAIDRALADPSFARATFMFRHHLFEALRLLGRAGEIPGLLGDWQTMIDLGATTVFEQLEPTRSDCHAWSAHPVFHLAASVAGIRPASPGFASVEIAPQPGPLKTFRAVVPHPQGRIIVERRLSATGQQWSIELPPGVPGVFRWEGVERTLEPGFRSPREAGTTLV